MPKIHVVDDYTGDTLEYESEKEIKIVKVSETKVIYDSEGEIIKKELLLENGKKITSVEDFDVFLDDHFIVYSPVYDVERPEKDEYSLYEEDDLLGYVNREYSMY